MGVVLLPGSIVGAVGMLGFRWIADDLQGLNDSPWVSRFIAATKQVLVGAGVGCARVLGVI